MDYSALIKRAEKVIKKHKEQDVKPSIFVSKTGEFPAQHAGLVVVLSQEPTISPKSGTQPA